MARCPRRPAARAREISMGRRQGPLWWPRRTMPQPAPSVSLVRWRGPGGGRARPLTFWITGHPLRYPSPFDRLRKGVAWLGVKRKMRMSVASPLLRPVRIELAYRAPMATPRHFIATDIDADVAPHHFWPVPGPTSPSIGRGLVIATARPDLACPALPSSPGPNINVGASRRLAQAGPSLMRCCPPQSLQALLSRLRRPRRPRVGVGALERRTLL